MSPDSFRGLLTPAGSDDRLPDSAPEPPYFADFYLDQIVAAACAGQGDHNLEAIYRTRLDDVSAIRWRQAVFTDLDRADTGRIAAEFCDELGLVHRRLALAGRLRQLQQQLRWNLNAIATYVDAVDKVTDLLDGAELGSDGMRAWREWLRLYREGAAYTEMADGVRGLLGELDAVRYDMLVSGAKVTVGPFDDEPDYSAEVLATFKRFRQGDVARHEFEVGAGAQLDTVESAVLSLVAQLYPDLFERLAAFWARHRHFMDRVVATVERELHFVSSWLLHIGPARDAGLEFSYPRLSDHDKTVHAARTFDLALARKILAADGGEGVVTNDVDLNGTERILVVSGPNQGGKTTLARTFGQLHHLACLGGPVPGAEVTLHVPDTIFSHFEREEHLDSLSGKLEDEVGRVHAILDSATSDSVVVMNEMFNSTTLADARELSESVLTTLADLDAVCLCVTFIDELSHLNDKTVSMVSTVDENDPAVRTFKVVRRAADGRAHALAIAEKYRLTRDALLARVQANA